LFLALASPINVDYYQRSMGELIDAQAAAQRLGVDIRTLYAYVSRGSLRRVPGPDGRSSRYDSDDLEMLAQRSRPRTLPRPAASIDLVISTRVSTVTDGVVRYRGKDVLDLVAAGQPFERVAELLWRCPEGDWPQPGPAEVAAAAFPEALCAPSEPAVPGTGVSVLKRLAITVAALPEPAGTALAADLPDFGRRLITCLTAVEGAAPGPAASRLWQRWSPLPPTGERIAALNTALVLLAEHELALSTLSVRVAASARATPGACILAGLGTMSGALHGGAARALHEALASRAAGRAEDMSPLTIGFGHPVHRHGDPRTAPLLGAVNAIATPADRALIEDACQAVPAAPSVDFALGALSYVARMPSEAATAIFAIARTAGWIAHAAEEYAEPGLRFRGRAFRPRTATPGRGAPSR
jgi:citrate synthase